MPFMEWSDAYNVGVGKFDGQHKELAYQINALHVAVTAGNGDRALGDLLNRLVAHTSSHFAAEEIAMAIFRVPGLDAHKSEHQKLRSEVFKLAEDFSAKRTSVSLDTLLFLRSWLLEHIEESDKNYGPHLKDKVF